MSKPEDEKVEPANSSSPVAADPEAPAIVAAAKDALKDEEPAQSQPTEYKASDPLSALRDQALSLVTDANRSQLAAILRSIADHYTSRSPAPAGDQASSVKTRDRFSSLEYKPRVMREEKKYPDRDWANLLSPKSDEVK